MLTSKAVTIAPCLRIARTSTETENGPKSKHAGVRRWLKLHVYARHALCAFDFSSRSRRERPKTAGCNIPIQVVWLMTWMAGSS